MGEQGRLTEWNDDRGFGFITPLDGGSRLFVHISEFPREHRRPFLNDLVVYMRSQDERGRPRATEVRFLAPTRAKTRSTYSTTEVGGGIPLSALGVSAVYFAVVFVLVATDLLPGAVLGASAVLSVLLFAIYGFDKSAAQRGAWRTAESSLHLGAIFGGWPGALVARHYFRHKTTKQPFRTIFWATVAINCIGLVCIVAAMAATPG